MSRFTAAHSASWGSNGPRNLIGPLGTRSLGGAELINLVEVSKFSTTVGDGASTSIVITHGLGTRDVRVQLYRATTPFDTVECEVEHTTATTVTLRFDSAPTSNQYRIVVLGATPSVPPMFGGKSIKQRPPARRGHFFSVPPTAVIAPAAPSIPPSFGGKSIKQRPGSRRGHFWSIRLVGRAPGQLDAPDRFGKDAPRVFPFVRHGVFFKVPLVGRAPGQLDAPDRFGKDAPRILPPARRGQFQPRLDAIIVATQFQALPPNFPTRHPRVVPPARRGRIAYFPLVGLAPAPPYPVQHRSRPKRAFFLTRPRKVTFFPLVGFAPGQLDVYPQITSRHPRMLPPVRRARGVFAVVPVVIPPGSQALPPQRIVPTRNRSFTTPRRGRFVYRPLLGLAPVYQPAPFATVGHRAKWLPPARRGSFLRVPLVGFAPGQRDAPDRFGASAPRMVPTARRGHFSNLPTLTQQLNAPTPITSRHPKLAPLPRRGRFLTAFTPTQMPVVPNLATRHARVLPPARRGTFFDVTLPVTQQPIAPSFGVRHVRSLPPSRRGKVFVAYTAVQQAVVPAFVPTQGARHARSLGPARHGRFWTAVTETQKQLAPMPIVSRHPRVLPPARRGHISTFVPPTPPKFAPAWIHRGGRRPAVLRRSQRVFNIPPLGGLPPLPDVLHQPSLLHYLNEPIRLQVTGDQVVLDNGVPKAPPIIWPPNTGIYVLTTVEKISLDGKQHEPQIIGWVVDGSIRLNVTVDRAVLSTSVDKVELEASAVLELVSAGHGVMSFDDEDYRPVNLNSLIRS